MYILDCAIECCILGKQESVFKKDKDMMRVNSISIFNDIMTILQQELPI